MDQNKGKIVASIIIAVALIYSVNVFKSAYMNKGYPGSLSVNGQVNTDLSGLINAIENSSSNKDVLSLDETAKYLGVKEDYFREMFYGGKLDSLPYLTIGGTTVFSKKALNEWIDNAAKTHLEIKP